MTWTDPVRYPNSAEIADNEAFLNTNVIDNLVDHETRIVANEGAWATWTPTYTNITIGNGVVTASYKQVGNTVFGRWGIKFGSTSSMGNGPTVSLPVTAKDTTPGAVEFSSSMLIGDAGVTQYYGFSRLITSSSNFGFFVLSTTSTYATYVGVTSTVPMTWTTNDTIGVSFTYEAA